jgi:predicted PurR-regulated permease PerM
VREGLAIRILFGLACFVVVVGGMKAAESLFVPFILALFLAILGSPIVYGIRKSGFSTSFAILVVFISGLTSLLGFTYLVSQAFAQFAAELPTIQRDLNVDITGLIAKLREKGFEIPEDRVAAFTNPGAVLDFVSLFFSSLTKILTDGITILFLVTFLLAEASDIPAKVRLMSKNPDRSLLQLEFLARQVFRYFAIKTLTSVMTGLFIGIWLKLFGVPYAVLMGILAFLLNYIPNVGSLLAAVPGVLIALVSGGLADGAATLFGYLVVNTAIGWVAEPRIMGEGLGLSNLVVILSLFFWGWVFGPVGMLLSAPLTMTVKIALQEIEETRWIAVLLSSGRSVSAQVEQMRASRELPSYPRGMDFDDDSPGGTDTSAGY